MLTPRSPQRRSTARRRVAAGLVAAVAATFVSVLSAAAPARAESVDSVAVGVGRETDQRVLQASGTTSGSVVTASTYVPGVSGTAVAAQRWDVDLSIIVDEEITPVYRLRNEQTGLCLARAAQNVNNAAVTAVTCNQNSVQQMWTVPTGGAFTGINLQSIADYRCLDLRGGATTSGAALRVSNCVTDWSIDDWYQRWRLRYSAWHCDRYSNSRLLTGLCVDTGSQPMFGAFGTWRNVGISFGADAATLPNTVNNFLEVSSRNGQNGDDAADGVEFGLHASYNADEGVQEYFPYWVEWGQGTEEYHGLSGVGGGDANGRVHSYIVLANDSGEWDILYDFNTVGTTQLQEGAQLSHTYANMSAVYPNTFTLAEPFENRVRVIDGNQQWRRPYLGETSRSEPKSCGALPTDVDPLWDEFNLAPWCMTTSQGTVSVPDLPVQVDYLRIGKPNAGAAKIASRAEPRRVDPTAPAVNGVDQKSLQQCLDADPYQCLDSVRGLRECVSKRAICNAGLEPADPAKDITAEQAASAARQLIAPWTKSRAAAAEPAMSVSTGPITQLPHPLRAQIDAPGSAEREVHVVTGDGTVDGLSAAQPDRYAGFTMVYDSQTGVLLYACLGKRCP